MKHFLSNKQRAFEEVDSLSLNRAMLFGDGIFETMVYHQGEIRFSSAHLERANRGLRMLHLLPEKPLDITRIFSLISSHFDSQCTYRIRWNIFRNGLGRYTPVASDFSELLTISDFQAAPKIKERAFISESVRLYDFLWANCKTLNALPYVLANQERVERKMDEVILLDSKGFLSEAGSSNLFWRKNGRIFTPSLNHACIAGVGRKHILERLRQLKIKHTESSFRPDELVDAEQVFVSNVSGISYLKHLNGRQFDTRPIPELESMFDLGTQS